MGDAIRQNQRPATEEADWSTDVREVRLTTDKHSIISYVNL